MPCSRKDATVSASCSQEPPLTEGKTVLENVEEGVADHQAARRGWTSWVLRWASRMPTSTS